MDTFLGSEIMQGLIVALVPSPFEGREREAQGNS